MRQQNFIKVVFSNFLILNERDYETVRLRKFILACILCSARTQKLALDVQTVCWISFYGHGSCQFHINRTKTVLLLTQNFRPTQNFRLAQGLSSALLHNECSQ